ncbi:MAG: hypothetical protein J6R77_06005 [Clostridia bacterium]|nr:hypothetical protein [Clostridia bacterium]
MKVAVIGHAFMPPQTEEALFRALPPATTALLCDKAAEEVATRVAHALRIPLTVTDNGAKEADEVLIFWDGTAGANSRLAAACVKSGKPVRLLPSENI